MPFTAVLAEIALAWMAGIAWLWLAGLVRLGEGLGCVTM